MVSPRYFHSYAFRFIILKRILRDKWWLNSFPVWKIHTKTLATYSQSGTTNCQKLKKKLIRGSNSDSLCFMWIGIISYDFMILNGVFIIIKYELHLHDLSIKSVLSVNNSRSVLPSSYCYYGLLLFVGQSQSQWLHFLESNSSSKFKPHQSSIQPHSKQSSPFYWYKKGIGVWVLLILNRYPLFVWIWFE